MRVDVIVNAPDAEAVEAVREQVSRLRDLGHEVHPRLTFEGGDARRFAREAAAEGAALVIAAGGDGTLNEAANGIHDHLDALEEERPPSPRGIPRLAVVPMGTANDLASALGIPMELEAAFDVAVSGEVSEIDVARVNGRCFLNVSSGGFGADATGETSSGAKNALGVVAYLITAARKFVRLEPTQGRFASDVVHWEGGFLLFAVGNSQRTGGGNFLTPEADPGDGLLDLCIVKEMPRRKLLALLPDLHAGQHLDHEGVIYRRVRSLVVETGETITVNADGEPLHGRSFRYDVGPHRLRVVRPRVAGEAAGEGATAA